jgi:hypothetical protein
MSRLTRKEIKARVEAEGVALGGLILHERAAGI